MRTILTKVKNGEQCDLLAEMTTMQIVKNAWNPSYARPYPLIPINPTRKNHHYPIFQVRMALPYPYVGFCQSHFTTRVYLLPVIITTY